MPRRSNLPKPAPAPAPAPARPALLPSINGSPYIYPHRYNIKLDKWYEDWRLEATCFQLGWDPSVGGLGRYEHFRNYMGFLYPDMIWNDWLERMLRSFCDDSQVVRYGQTIVRVVSLVGVAAAGKTFATGRFAYAWWYANPLHSIAILTSTTKSAIGQRVWPVIQKSYHEARANLAKLHGIEVDRVDGGHLIDSKKILAAGKGIEDRAIFAQAVKDGETSKAETFIQGQHAPRILVVIDEANETPEAIFGVLSNLRKACQDLTVIILGNPISKLDPHGRACAPRGGWGNRPVGAVSWPTQGVPEWQLDPGVCLQFKGSDSPNVKQGRTIFPFLYTWEDYQASLREGIRGTLRYWKYDAGEWAPDGVCKTVFNETMAETCGLKEKPLWLGKPVTTAFLDPGFGGDACVLAIGLLGDVEDASLPRQGLSAFVAPARFRKVLFIQRMIELEVGPDVRGPDGKLIDQIHQIARQVVELSTSFGFAPANFGLFSTGTGMGIASTLFSDWSNEIFKVEEGGAPSERPLSETEPKPAKELCDRRVTELWFSARAFADSRQLMGLDPATLVELCTREYDMVGKPARYRIETKDEFKPKLGHSPDRADAVVGLCELVKVRHGVRGGLSETGRAQAEQEAREQSAQPDPWAGTYTSENARELEGVGAEGEGETYRFGWP